MATYIFANNGYDSNIVAIEAESETEARGILQRETATGMEPSYQGTLDDLMGDDEFINLTRL